MPIKKDLSDLPTGGDQLGNPPVPKPMFVTKLAEAWFELDNIKEAGGKPMSVADRSFRASWASTRCDRALAYNIAQVPESNPPTLADRWRMSLGNLVQDALEPAIRRAFPDAQYEVAVDLRPDVDGAASVDLHLVEHVPLDEIPVRFIRAHHVEEDKAGDLCEFRTTMELKTVNGYAFKVDATNFNGPPNGPKSGAVIQGALAAFKQDADRLIVGNLSMENLAPNLGHLGYGEAGRFAAEWWYTWDEIEEIALKEHKRIRWACRQVDRAMVEQTNITTDGIGEPYLAIDRAVLVRLVPRRLADPEYPSGAIVTNPKGSKGKGTWMTFAGGVAGPREQVTQAGTYWGCGYCRHLDTCVADGEDSLHHADA